MRAARLKEAEPRELVSIAWGLTAAGVAFSESFTNDLLLTTASNKSEFKRGYLVVLSQKHEDITCLQHRLSQFESVQPLFILCTVG